jgi:YfiH family protein
VAPGSGIFAVFHAGWRGTANRIVEKGVSKLLEVSGAKAEEVLIAFGPCIRKCCYEVGEEVKRAFAAARQEVSRIFSGPFLDLVEANRRQLFRLEVTRILDSNLCTACRTDVFYSYRRERTPSRIWTIAGFKEPSESPS